MCDQPNPSCRADTIEPPLERYIFGSGKPLIHIGKVHFEVFKLSEYINEPFFRHRLNDQMISFLAYV